jgi:DNA topoisomerase IB
MCRFRGAQLRFSFRGKSGVEHCISIHDTRLARIVQRCQYLHGQELFQFLDILGKRGHISPDDVNVYLRKISGRDITAKDFRTWGGTMVAALELQAMGPATSRREADSNIVRALDAVAERLGNTRAMCRTYYVHPGLLLAYHLGLTASFVRCRYQRCGVTRSRCCSSCMIRYRSGSLVGRMRNQASQRGGCPEKIWSHLSRR